MSTSASRPSTRRGDPQARHAERRARIVAVARASFGTVGYHRTAIEDLCARAGVGTRAFYEHFASKEELMRTVYDDVVGALAAAALAAMTAAPIQPEPRIRAGLDAMMRHVAADDHAARIQLVECIGVSPAMELHRRSVLHDFAALIAGQSEELAAAGALPRPITPLRAMALVGATNELLTDWILASRRPARTPIVDELTELYALAFSPPG